LSKTDGPVAADKKRAEFSVTPWLCWMVRFIKDEESEEIREEEDASRNMISAFGDVNRIVFYSE
jgi:hypothetical protein